MTTRQPTRRGLRLRPAAGSTLLAATRADGSPLFPVLASVPSDQQAQAATGVVSAITQCVEAGQGVMPGPDDIKSFVLDLSGDVPTYASSTEPGVVKAPLVGADRLGSLSDWWDSVENDADSFFHGLRHNVGELIAEAGQNARQIEAWLDQLPGFVTGQLTEYGQLADGFFASLETAIDEKIDTIVMPGLKQQTFRQPGPERAAAAFEVEKFLSGVQHNWLLDKIESFFADDTPTQVNTDLQAALDELGSMLSHGFEDIPLVSKQHMEPARHRPRSGRPWHAGYRGWGARPRHDVHARRRGAANSAGRTRRATQRGYHHRPGGRAASGHRRRARQPDRDHARHRARRRPAPGADHPRSPAASAADERTGR